MPHLFPADFENYMKNQLKDSWNDFVEAHNRVSPVSIRLNPFKRQQDSNPPIPWTTDGRYLKERPVFTLDPMLHAGAYYVQEASSMFLEQALKQTVALDQPLRVLDLCAAPGGKSTHVASLLNQDSILISNEVIRSRVNVLAENLQKWGSNNVVVTNNDASDFQALPGAFDVIILDAPCSGEGLFRKDANAMAEWSSENVQLCAARQKRILADLWPALKGGGILIYSTCTYNPIENEYNLQWLSENHPIEFVSLQLQSHWGIEEVEQSAVKGYRFYPHNVAGEGFFLSVIRKSEPEVITHTRSARPIFTTPGRKTIDQVREWILNPENKTFIQRENTIQFFPSRYAGFIEQIARQFRIHFAGTFLGTVKHEKIIPEHALALSGELNKEFFNAVELSREEALHYLRKDALNPTTNHRGFALATYQHLPLGWMNLLPGRMNNLYPQEWRIRMSF